MAGNSRFRRRRQNTSKKLTDYRLVYTVGALTILGWLMVFSASAPRASQPKILADGTEVSGDPFEFFIKQAIWIGVGVVFAFIAYKLPLKLVSKLSVPVMLVSIVLLFTVLIIGTDINGARRWIDLKLFTLQPSEVAKLGFIIYLAAWLSRVRPKIKSYKEVLRRHLYDDLLPFMLLMGLVCALIVLQPDLDTAAIIAVTALTIYFVSGKDAIHTLGSIFIVVTAVVVGVIAGIAAPYRLDRINTWLEFLNTGGFSMENRLDSGFQIWNGLVAIGNGDILGQGFGESKQKFFYLNDAAFTDSIFAVIGEEFGLVGTVALTVSFLLIMSIGVGITRRAPDKFSALLAMGITTWLVIQAFLNIGANLAIIPFGGIPLPFLSYGGSNTIINLIAVGLLLNVQRNGDGPLRRNR